MDNGQWTMDNGQLPLTKRKRIELRKSFSAYFSLKGDVAIAFKTERATAFRGLKLN